MRRSSPSSGSTTTARGTRARTSTRAWWGSTPSTTRSSTRATVETRGLRLPGKRVDNGDGSFDVLYDIPAALYDCAFDDGVVPHQDFHNGCGESHPEQWGKTFFRHFPNHGFVGDVFTVNGKAYPLHEVKRRKYRLRFLTAAVSRQFEVSNHQVREGPGGPRWTWGSRTTSSRASGGSPTARSPCGSTANRDRWRAPAEADRPRRHRDRPAMRHEVVVDFTKTADGKPTVKGDVFYVVNTAKMPDGRKLESSVRMGNADSARSRSSRS